MAEWVERAERITSDIREITHTEWQVFALQSGQLMLIAQHFAWTRQRTGSKAQRGAGLHTQVVYPTLLNMKHFNCCGQHVLRKLHKRISKWFEPSIMYEFVSVVSLFELSRESVSVKRLLGFCMKRVRSLRGTWIDSFLTYFKKYYVFSKQ